MKEDDGVPPTATALPGPAIAAGCRAILVGADPSPTVSASGRVSTDAADWIEWRGGKCPLKLGAKHYRRYRGRHGSDLAYDTCPGDLSGLVIWGHRNDDCDIIAYAIAPEDEKS